MEKIGFYCEEILMEITTFLEDVFAGMEKESYEIVPHPDGGGDGWVYLSEMALNFLETYEPKDEEAKLILDVLIFKRKNL
jgi:hypothetical protein